MPKYIDADALLSEAKRLSGPQTGDGWSNWGIYALIERQPAADVEPVIHCKDCVHGCPAKGHEPDVYCSWWDYPMPPTGFCSKARKVEIYQDLDDIYEDYTGATEVNFNDMMREKENKDE